MPTALEVYNSCMNDNSGNLGAEDICLSAARAIDQNFVPTGQSGSGFWSDPNNIVNLLGSAGAATGQWLDAFGIQPGGAAQYQPTTPTPPKESGMPAWAWVLIILAVLALFIILILFLRK